MNERLLQDWLKQMFAALDADGVPGLFPWLHDDLGFRFAGYPPGRGRQAFAEAWAAMSGNIRGMQHRIDRSWELGEECICRGEVTYRLIDGRTVRAPFANFFRLHGGRISEYLVYVDASAVIGAAPD